jgi:dienelactone hydrolase
MFLELLVSTKVGTRRASDLLFTRTAPLYIVAPNTDSLYMPEQRTRTVEILAKNEQQFNMQVISGVSHGFAVSPTLHFFAIASSNTD